MKTTWKILSIKATDGLITQAQYYVCAVENDMAVETEGTWFFKDPKMVVPFENVTEQIMVDWIKLGSDGLIQNRLSEQLKNLAEQHETPLPWMRQVFTLEIEE